MSALYRVSLAVNTIQDHAREEAQFARVKIIIFRFVVCALVQFLKMKKQKKKKKKKKKMETQFE